MKSGLADRLLAKVMNWSEQDVARERPVLQVLADLKYDEYQQFSPGMRFVESLALWLEQFESRDERLCAYEFIKSRLVFFSGAEMNHYASVAYREIIRPKLLERAARIEKMPRYAVGGLLDTRTFELLEKSTLVCGLSDGARIDYFRRANPNLSHEQVFQDYDLSEKRLQEQAERLSSIGNDPPCGALVLIDDFTASGTSYFRESEQGYRGKVARFLQQTMEDSAWRSLVRYPDTIVIVAVYVATKAAMARIRDGSAKVLGNGAATVSCVQTLPDEIRLKRRGVDPFSALAEKYYDDALEDEHTRKGKTDLRFGFAGGGLPVVLHHNTPNNSLFLLWSSPGSEVTALFPRVTRHRSAGGAA